MKMLLSTALATACLITADMAMQFYTGFSKGRKGQCPSDREVRDRLSEKQIDCMVDDSFPASDPPSTY